MSFSLCLDPPVTGRHRVYHLGLTEAKWHGYNDFTLWNTGMGEGDTRRGLKGLKVTTGHKQRSVDVNKVRGLG